MIDSRVALSEIVYHYVSIDFLRNIADQRHHQQVCHRRLPDHELVPAGPGNAAIYGDTFIRKTNDRGAYEMGRIGDNEYASILVRRHLAFK